MNYYSINLFSDLNNFLPDVMVKLLELSIIFSLYRLIIIYMKSKENSLLEIKVNQFCFK